MNVPVAYTRKEKFWLAVLAVFGFAGINGAFIYGVLLQPRSLSTLLTDPVTLAFAAEAMVLVGVLAYLFERWGVSRVRWGWFVVLSLVGSLAFSIPVALLARRKQPDTAE